MKIEYKKYFWSFIIVLASDRGAFVYHLGLHPEKTYILTSMLLIGIGLLSYRSMWVNNGDKSLVLLRKAIKVNALLIGFYMLLSMVTISLNQYSMVYLFAIFPIIFTLIKYNERLLNGIVYAITLVTVLGVVYFYSLGISGGFDAIYDAHSKLRDHFSYSRIGENLLPGGYQGNHHDAANILVMCGVFLMSKALFESRIIKKCLLFGVYFAVIFTTLLTGSTANIIVLIGVSGLVSMLYLNKRPLVMMLIVGCAFFAMPFLLERLAEYTYFYEKASGDQISYEAGGMLNALDINSIVSSFHAILLGGGNIFYVPMIISEVAFVKNLVGIGLIPFSVFMFICFSPVYYIYKYGKSSRNRAKELRNNNLENSNIYIIKTMREQRFRLIIMAMPAFAGVMTMLHYGSLFRVTSVGLFCVLLALFFKNYLALIQREFPSVKAG